MYVWCSTEYLWPALVVPPYLGPCGSPIHVKLTYIKGWQASIYTTGDMKAIWVESYKIFAIAEGKRFYLSKGCTCSATSKAIPSLYLVHPLSILKLYKLENLGSCMFLYNDLLTLYTHTTKCNGGKRTMYVALIFLYPSAMLMIPHYIYCLILRVEWFTQAFKI